MTRCGTLLPIFSLAQAFTPGIASGRTNKPASAGFSWRLQPDRALKVTRKPHKWKLNRNRGSHLNPGVNAWAKENRRRGRRRFPLSRQSLSNISPAVNRKGLRTLFLFLFVLHTAKVSLLISVRRTTHQNNIDKAAKQSFQLGGFLRHSIVEIVLLFRVVLKIE